MWELTAQGLERVAVCKDCRCASTGDVRSLNAFTNVYRKGGYIELCKECAAVESLGAVGVMAQLIGRTKAS